MKKTLLLVAALALTTLSAQAKDSGQMEATVSQIIDDARQATSDKKEEATAPKGDKNDTQKKEVEEQTPSKDAK